MIPLGLRIDGSDALLQALDDHMRTFELVKQLAVERDGLRETIARLRLTYAELVHAQQEQMRHNLLCAGWVEVGASVWRSPQRRIFRGVASAWHAMRSQK